MKAAAGRIGALRLHATRSAEEATAAARAGFAARFLDEVDPGRVLPETDRLRRADFAMRAHMARLAMRSAQSRRKAPNKQNATVRPVAFEGEVRDATAQPPQ